MNANKTLAVSPSVLDELAKAVERVKEPKELMSDIDKVRKEALLSKNDFNSLEGSQLFYKSLGSFVKDSPVKSSSDILANSANMEKFMYNKVRSVITYIGERSHLEKEGLDNISGATKRSYNNMFLLLDKMNMLKTFEDPSFRFVEQSLINYYKKDGASTKSSNVFNSLNGKMTLGGHDVYFNKRMQIQDNILTHKDSLVNELKDAIDNYLGTLVKEKRFSEYNNIINFFFPDYKRKLKDLHIAINNVKNMEDSDIEFSKEVKEGAKDQMKQAYDEMTAINYEYLGKVRDHVIETYSQDLAYVSLASSDNEGSFSNYIYVLSLLLLAVVRREYTATNKFSTLSEVELKYYRLGVIKILENLRSFLAIPNEVIDEIMLLIHKKDVDASKVTRKIILKGENILLDLSESFKTELKSIELNIVSMFKRKTQTAELTRFSNKIGEAFRDYITNLQIDAIEVDPYSLLCFIYSLYELDRKQVPSNYVIFNDVRGYVRLPYGITLVVGPSHSGKSSLLNKLGYYSGVGMSVIDKITATEPDLFSRSSREAVNMLNHSLSSRSHHCVVIDSLSDFLNANDKSPAGTGGISLAFLSELADLNAEAIRHRVTIIGVINTQDKQDVEKLLNTLNGRVSATIKTERTGDSLRFGYDYNSRLYDHRFNIQLDTEVEGDLTRFSLNEKIKELELLDDELHIKSGKVKNNTNNSSRDSAFVSDSYEEFSFENFIKNNLK